MATPGRFECDFVKKPQKEFQSECPVCLQVLREPHQVSCCGNSFCRGCIDKIQADNKPCPTCNEDNFSTFHNKGLQCTLYEFEVYCSHKEEGCDWKGELGQLDNHLNLSSQPDKQLEGCKYSEIECIYCSESIKRCDITIHQGDHCDKRPFSCEYCHSYESHYEDVIHNHWPVCDYHPVHCPNECGKVPQCQALENHIAEDCPKTVIDCDFRHVGCDVSLPRKDMPAHLKENLVTHMSLQAASHSKLLASLQDRVHKLEGENVKLKIQLQVSQEENQQAVARIEEVQQGILKYITMPTLPNGYVEITMENFEQHKKDSDRWHSPPFYTHPGGYKFCLRVDANGYGDGWFGGRGSFVSVFVHLMRGEFDDQLKFPFRGHITVQLVDQEGGEKHWTKTIHFDDQAPSEYAGRVAEGESRKKGWGSQQFISHGQLKCNYLKNSSVHFRITKIDFE